MLGKIKKFREMLNKVKGIIPVLVIVLVQLCFLVANIKKGNVITVIILYMGMIIFCFLLLFLGLRIPEIESNRKEEKEKDRFNLSKDEFTEVFFAPPDTGSAMQMCLDVQEKHNIRYFAKLTENEEIYLVLKEGDEIVKDYSIENWIYFGYNFKLTDQKK